MTIDNESLNAEQFFRRTHKIIYNKVMDEKNMKDWEDFYTFIGGGVNAFLNAAAEQTDKAPIALLLLKLVMFSYYEAKVAQPSVDFDIFRYMYANELDHNFHRIYASIKEYEEMNDEEREAYTSDAAEGRSVH